MVCQVDPSSWIANGMDLKLRSAHGTFEARLIDIQKSPSTWVLVLSPHFNESDCFMSDGSSRCFAVCIRDTAKIDEIAMRACHSSEDPQVRAEACLIVGRSRHVHGDVSAALQFYRQARDFAPLFPLTCFRHAQTLALSGRRNCVLTGRPIIVSVIILPSFLGTSLSRFMKRRKCANANFKISLRNNWNR